MQTMSMEQALRELTDCLKREIEVHEAAGEMMAAKLERLRAGRATELRELCAQENTLIQAASEFAKQRMILAAQLTRQVKPDASEPMTLGQLIGFLPEGERDALAELRERLQQRMQDARQRTGVTRKSVEHLVRHMAGLVRTIGGALSNGPAYGSTGKLPSKALAVSTFSTTG